MKCLQVMESFTMAKKWQREERITFDGDEYFSLTAAYESCHQVGSVREFIKELIARGMEHTEELSDTPAVRRFLLIRKLEQRDELLTRLATLASRGDDEAQDEFLSMCEEHSCNPDTYLTIAENLTSRGIASPQVSTDTTRCALWLQSTLENRGFVDSIELISSASNLGFPYMCFYRACQLLQVRRRRDGKSHQIALPETASTDYL